MSDVRKKISILVDKVMQPEDNWKTREWMIRETAEAGFSIFSPRKGYDDLDEVRSVADWCGKYGMLHMPWMSGTLDAPAGEESEGRRLTWSDGLEQSIWSPNSDEFWEWTGKYVVEYSKISRKNKSLTGVFLDYENYAPGKPRRDGNCYPISYDEDILARFGERSGVSVPELEPSKRAAWLEERGMAKDFTEYQISHWRAQCRNLREQVDLHNPEFRFCIYPAPGTLFMREACYPEWATERAPLILADAASYGRYSRFATQDDALLENRRKLAERMEVPSGTGIPFTYLGGIDPVVIGADPEFCGKNALSIGQATEGYWVFYEGLEYRKEHPEYFKWFKWANAALADGRMDAWREPRVTPDEWGIALREDGSGRRVASAPVATDQNGYSSPADLLFNNTLLLGAEAGREIRLRTSSRVLAGDGKVGSIKWEVLDPAMALLGQGLMAGAADGEISLKTRASGTHILRLESEEYSYSILSSNVPLGLYAGRRVNFRRVSGRLYFRVQEDLGSFMLIARGSRKWSGKLRVLDPEGGLASEGEAAEQKKKIRLETPVRGRSGIWSLEVSRDDDDPMGYISIQVLKPPTLLPVLSTRPEDVFTRL